MTNDSKKIDLILNNKMSIEAMLNYATDTLPVIEDYESTISEAELKTYKDNDENQSKFQKQDIDETPNNVQNFRRETYQELQGKLMTLQYMIDNIEDLELKANNMLITRNMYLDSLR